MSKPETILERIGDAMAGVLDDFKSDERIPGPLHAQMTEAWSNGLSIALEAEKISHRGSRANRPKGA